MILECNPWIISKGSILWRLTIEDRHGKRSTIIASQLPVSVWHEVIAEQTIAGAILDRMVHNSLRIDLKGESMRRKKADQKISLE
jgi:DNA replication protein DnaC